MDAPIDWVRAQAYTIPTDFAEADGTASWTSTTIVVVHVSAAGRVGVGYTYTHPSAGALIDSKLAPLVVGRDAMDPPGTWRAMNVAVRNLGREGLGATAISAVDTALWDLKAVVLDQSLAALLGRHRASVPIYGSGGFR
jgi:L-alanine-DL-glutamate epimerase-like enolase superfamily enzyme